MIIITEFTWVIHFIKILNKEQFASCFKNYPFKKPSPLLSKAVSSFYLYQMDDNKMVVSVDAQGNKIVLQYNYDDKLSQAITEISAEVMRAKTMFPTDFHNQHEAYAVILEEIDELWDEIKKNHKKYDLAAQRIEATQAAAMLVRLMVELL